MESVVCIVQERQAMLQCAIDCIRFCIRYFSHAHQLSTSIHTHRCTHIDPHIDHSVCAAHQTRPRPVHIQTKADALPDVLIDHNHIRRAKQRKQTQCVVPLLHHLSATAPPSDNPPPPPVPPPPPPPPRPETKKGRQKLAKKTRQEEAHQSVYQLSTKSYYDMCGFLAATKTRDRWRKAAGLKDMDAQLSRDFETCNSRTWYSNVYLAYVESTTATWWSRVWDEVSQPKHQKLRFSVYQKQQRAFHTVAVQLCNKNIANSGAVGWWWLRTDLAWPRFRTQQAAAAQAGRSRRQDLRGGRVQELPANRLLPRTLRVLSSASEAIQEGHRETATAGAADESRRTRATATHTTEITRVARTAILQVA